MEAGGGWTHQQQHIGDAHGLEVEGSRLWWSGLEPLMWVLPWPW